MLPRRRSDDAIRLLLSGGRLGADERERLLARVLRAVAAARAPWTARWRLAALIPAVAAAALLLRGPRPPAPPWLAARGAVGAPVVQARCAGRAPGACRRGDRLLFEVDGAAAGGLLAAYAERAGQRIWYFPTAAGRLSAIPATSGHALLPEAARLGDEHVPGRYALRLVVLDGPASRADLVAGRARVRASVAVPLEVLP